MFWRSWSLRIRNADLPARFHASEKASSHLFSTSIGRISMAEAWCSKNPCTLAIHREFDRMEIALDGLSGLVLALRPLRLRR
jgi:hypothetical protein